MSENNEAPSFVSSNGSPGSSSSDKFVAVDSPFSNIANRDNYNDKPRYKEAKEEDVDDSDREESDATDDLDNSDEDTRENEEQDDEEVEERTKKETELKRLKNSVPALQRKTNELMQQNKMLAEKVNSFDQERAKIAENVVNEVWKKVIDNFDELQDEILKQKGISPEEYKREQFLKLVEMETMSDAQRKIYEEKKELERQIREMQPYREREQQRLQQEQEQQQREKRTNDLSSIAQYVAKLAEDVGIPKGSDTDTLELVDMMLDVFERASNDPAFAHMTDNDVVKYYADHKWKTHLGMVGRVEWDAIKSKPEAKKYLEHCQRIVRSASLSSGGASITLKPKRDEYQKSSNNRNKVITESEMMAKLTGRA